MNERNLQLRLTAFFKCNGFIIRALRGAARERVLASFQQRYYWTAQHQDDATDSSKRIDSALRGRCRHFELLPSVFSAIVETFAPGTANAAAGSEQAHAQAERF